MVNPVSVTIKDISRITGISVSTVSRALRYPEQVSEKKRKIILSMADELGYIPNLNASNLRTNASKNIGFIINDVQNTFFNQLITVIERELSSFGYKLIISFGTNDQVDNEDKIKNLLSTSVNALMFSPFRNSPYVQNLLESKNVYTLQLFTKAYQSFDSLIVDDLNGTYLATKRLILNNHHNILITGFRDAIWQERLKGYYKAYQEFNIEVDPELIYLIDSDEFLINKLTTKIMNKQPSAIIPIANKVGFAVVKALRTLGLKTNRDISVICYDDTVWADILDLTVVTHHIEELGRQIVKMLMEGIGRGEQQRMVRHEIIEPFILDRRSVHSHK